MIYCVVVILYLPFAVLIYGPVQHFIFYHTGTGRELVLVVVVVIVILYSTR